MIAEDLGPVLRYVGGEVSDLAVVVFIGMLCGCVIAMIWARLLVASIDRLTDAVREMGPPPDDDA